MIKIRALFPVDIPQNSKVRQQKEQISELQFDKFPTRSSFLCWKIRFKNQVTTCSDFPSNAMLWIKEVEMVDSLDDLKFSRSVCGDAGREDCLCSEQDDSEFPVQDEEQSGGTESSE